jgi:hypothetical protein
MSDIICDWPHDAELANALKRIRALEAELAERTQERDDWAFATGKAQAERDALKAAGVNRILKEDSELGCPKCHEWTGVAHWTIRHGESYDALKARVAGLEAMVRGVIACEHNPFPLAKKEAPR